MKNGLIVTIFFCSLSLFSQENVKWGLIFSTRERVEKIYQISSGNYAIVRDNNYVNSLNNLIQTESVKIKSNLGDGFEKVEEICQIGENFVSFISSKSHDIHSLVAKKYSSDFLNSSHMANLLSYEMPKGKHINCKFVISFSENNKFFCAFYDLPGSNLRNYKVFDSDLKTIFEGSIHTSNDEKVEKVKVSNYGVLSFYSTVKVKDNKIHYLNFPQLDSKFELKLASDKCVNQYYFEIDSNNIAKFYGTYFEKSGDKVISNGLFFQTIDLKSQHVLFESTQSFAPDFIKEDLSSYEKLQLDKIIKKGKIPHFNQYVVKNIFTLDDGSVIGVLEESKLTVVNGTVDIPVSSPRTITTGTQGSMYGYGNSAYSYSSTRSVYGKSTTNQYNDLIVFKMKSNGEFEWIKKIHKYQVANGLTLYPYSICCYVTKQNLVILFNDNIKNYDEMGNFSVKKEINIHSKIDIKKTAFIKCEIDLNTGNYSRNKMVDSKKSRLIYAPSKFFVDQNSKEIIVVGYIDYSKEKIGVYSFD